MIKRKTKRRTVTKPRSDCLVFSALADENGSIHIELKGKQVLVNGAPAQDVRVERSHKREGKSDKVVSSVNFGAGMPSVTGQMSQWSPHDAILQRFDSLVAVDTNTRFQNDMWASVTAAWITESGWKNNNGMGGIKLRLHCLLLELLAEKPIDPEGRGWYAVLNFGLDQDQNINLDQSIGLIVDSKLGDHDKINGRTLGYFANFLLPPNFSLAYASDQSADSLPNTMIRLCDKSAKDTFTAIEAGKVNISALTPPALVKIVQA